MENTKNELLAKVAFVGQPNVGKSSLLNALVGTKIAPTSRKPQTTRKSLRGIKTLENCQQIYFDTPGAVQKKTALDKFMHAQIFDALKNVDQVVAIVDCSTKFDANDKFLKKIKKICSEENLILILAINKIDLLKEKSALLSIIKNYSEAFSPQEIIPISAEKRKGLDDLFATIKKNAKESPFLFEKNFFTDVSEKEIVCELIREKALLELKNEIPYRLAVTIEEFNEERRDDSKKPLVEIEAIFHVERKSQKAIVIGKGGSRIKEIGIRARKELENLLDCQVMLKIFVRVEEDWVNKGRSLNKLGF